MTAVIIPFDQSPLTPEDEALMVSVAPRLAAFGLLAERNTGRGFDGYRIRPPHSPLPRWVVLRLQNGGYQLQDGFMSVLAKGPTLESVVFPGWLPPHARRHGARSRHARTHWQPAIDRYV